MTVSTTTSVVTYSGNGATTVFTFPFIGVNPSDLEVIYTNSLGVATTLSPSVYTLVINPVPLGGLWGIGGSVTYPNTGSPPVPIPAGTELTINRIVPYEQTVSINNQGAFYPQAVEQGLDLLELQIQQIGTEYEFTLKTPVSDLNPPNTLPSAAARANGILGFDSNGQPIIVSSTSGGGGGTPSVGTPRRVSTTGTATINVLTSDTFGGIAVYQSGSPVTTVQLPTTGSPYPVFDASLNANSFPITVLPPAGKTILGQTSYVLAFAGQMASFFNDGTQILVGG